MDTVVVGVVYVRSYLQLVSSNVVTVVDPDRPARRLIYHSEILEFYVSTARDENNSGGSQRILSLIEPTRVVIGRQLDIRLAVTVNYTVTRDRNILAFLGVDQARVAPAGQHFRFNVIDRSVLRKVIAIGRCEENAVRLQMKLNVLLQAYSSRHVLSAGYYYPSASRGGTIVNSLLYLFCVESFSVADGAVFTNIKNHFSLRSAHTGFRA